MAPRSRSQWGSRCRHVGLAIKDNSEFGACGNSRSLAFNEKAETDQSGYDGCEPRLALPFTTLLAGHSDSALR